MHLKERTLPTETTDLDAICYRRNFVSFVVARADFAEEQEALGKPLPEPIRAEINKRFEISEPRSIQATTVKVQPSTGEMKSEKSETQVHWHFRSKDGFRRAAISPEFVTVEYTAFDRFETLNSDFRLMVSCLERAGVDPLVRRLGLRYVNTIELPFREATKPDALDWEGLIDQRLLAGLSFTPEEDRWATARYFSNSCLSFQDAQLTLNYGIFNDDYPQPARKRQFILDIDASSSKDLTPANLLLRLEKNHRLIQSYFERAIGPQLRALMEPTQNG